MWVSVRVSVRVNMRVSTGQRAGQRGNCCHTLRGAWSEGFGCAFPSSDHRFQEVEMGLFLKSRTGSYEGFCSPDS